VVSPPVLEVYVEADYPPEAFVQGLEAEVLARIAVDESGAVTGVEVLEPAGHGFDEAAVAAMLGFRFEPATRDGEPIASQVTYRYRFFITEVETAVEEETEPPPAVLAGRVTDLDDAAIEGASLVLAAAAGEVVAEATTDAEGRFELADVAAGAYQLSIAAAGFEPSTSEEELAAGERLEVVYRLAFESSDYETVVRGKRPPREVTRREVTAREITKVPGTSGDALRAIQNLPGVARPSAMGGELIVRGSSPWDSVYFFDSLNTPFIYHFGGLTSTINSDLIERIDFFPGSYSVRYGRATGGAIDVITRAPRSDRIHAYIDADVWDAGALVETPLGDDWSLAVSARRSYVDAILANIDTGDMKYTVAPRYYDFQILADYHPSTRDNLRLFGYGTDDRMVFVWDNSGEDPTWEGDLNLHMWAYQLQASWVHRFDKAVANELRLGFGSWGGDYDESEMRQDWYLLPILIRDELTWNPGRFAIVRLGTDTELRWGDSQMHVPTDYGGEGEGNTWEGANQRWLDFEASYWIVQPALYAELELTAVPRTTFIYGLRVDYHSTTHSWSVDPRVVVRHELFPGTTLKGGIGLFHQPADFAQGSPEYGNPDLDPQAAIHYSAGVEQRLPLNLELGLEGFYKELSSLITSSDDIVERDGELVYERFDNDGRGRVYGLEAQLKYPADEHFFGWIAYTLMHSERVDEPGGEPRLFDYDQTHVLTVLGSLRLGWGIDIGVRFRLASGNPYTPVEGSIYDADSDTYSPLVGKTNSDRMPLFHQLDVRVDKKWQWRYLALTVYLDVQNVYNFRSVEAVAYNYDWSQKAYIRGLPILPSLGLKLEY